MTCKAIGVSGSNPKGLEVVDKGVVELDRGLEDQVWVDAYDGSDVRFAGELDRLGGNDLVRWYDDAVKTCS